MSKKILGLDLGTTSIGWAFVKEAENDEEHSTIEKIGIRVNPLTTDEQISFEKGKPITVNADRTLKRGSRRNLQRYKQRRDYLIQVLNQHGFITQTTVLAENAKNTTHITYALRAKAASKEVSNEEFARILLMINKKRGYKSSRKVKNEEEGQVIDGMAIAKRLYEENLTPGQLCYQLLKEGKKQLPDFYRSDLQIEFEKAWNFQKQFHSEILTEEFRKEIEGKGQRATAASFWGKYKFNTAEKKGTKEEKKLQAYEWRSKSINTVLTKEEIAFVISEINNNINSSSGYLGNISDRSKELFFNKKTVGQYLYKQLQDNPHTRLKNQVFYRQDYLDEFDVIWETQAKFHKKLTPQLKSEIRDVVIFYQRKLKSQKGLIGFCEFENKEIKLEKNGKKTNKIIGFKVAPKSSPLFQEFKIWQTLNNLKAQKKVSKETIGLDLEARQTLFDELNIKGNLTKDTILTILGHNPKEWELNFSIIEGNRTNHALYDAYFKMMEMEGHDEIEWQQIPVEELKTTIKVFLDSQNIKPEIQDFNAELKGKDFEKQLSYQLWHLLYAYESDKSNSGNDRLYELLFKKFGFKKEFAQLLSNIPLQQDYGSLSAKAIRKIFPFIRENKFDEACALAGYNHSSSLTKEENEIRPLKEKLELLPKNSLRNPVVEKILNQMVNLVNAIIGDPSMGKPEEIRIELARELKKNAEERAEMSSNINKAKSEHDTIRKLLMTEFGIKNPTRNDIIRYKLYEELKINGFKTLYSNTYIQREKLFSKEFDIEHIIPKSLLFDDSFSNKTLCVRHENIDKGDKTAYDFIEPYFGKEMFEQYLARVEMMHNTKENGISKAKYKKLLMKAVDIGEGFIERDLRDSQYIAKKAKSMLLGICKTVLPTTGSITDRLREDWGLINIMQELNFEKYKKRGLTELVEKKDGGTKERIIDWTKRNDHRHHAMDALTIAFTKHNHIQYLNYLNARKNENHKMHGKVIAIEHKETELIIDSEGKKKRKFKLPLPNFREEARKHLENVLVSYKAKNKVVTKNKNRFKIKDGVKIKIELTPRGQLHKETIYGRLQQYVVKEEKPGAKFDQATILKVSDLKQRNALMQRLRENNNDPQKAFTGKNSPNKNPIYLDEENKIKISNKVKLVWLEHRFSSKEEICAALFEDSKNNDDFYNRIKKVYDKGVRNALIKRYEQVKSEVEKHNQSAKTNKEKRKILDEAFSNLDKNPIWLNEAKGIAIKKITFFGVKNAESLHYKKDHLGQNILDGNGYKMPVDFVSTSNNHHIAIYRDTTDELQEKVVSFYEAVERVNQGLPVIDKIFNEGIGWQFLFTLKQNEFFIFPNEGFEPSEIDLLNPMNYKIISPNLFRVQTISIVQYENNTIRDFKFRHHLETTVDDKKELKDITYKQIKSLAPLRKIIKVRVNHIGQIVRVGEY